ncbi:MAG TPA: serine hydrolase [Herpetosiphonaceae bacterium]
MQIDGRPAAAATQDSAFALERSAPEAQGIDSAAILAFVRDIERAGIELHSLMLLRHGAVVAEGWWAPYAPERPHMLFSLTKSFTATAVGFAQAEGLLSLDDPVTGFFPDDLPAEISPNLAAMQVRHLLAMSAGHDTDVMEALFAEPDGNWPRAFLAQPVQHAPGAHFAYDSGTSYMLSAIVTRLTGQPILEYLRPRLFEPLGIVPASWITCPRGANIGGWGLSLATEGIARFGQCYLQNGAWRGAQVLPAGWVELASAAHTANGTDPDSDWAQGYGFQLWRCRHGAYRGDGAFGQYCIVLPAQDAVLAITGGLPDMQAPLNLAWDHLLPAMRGGPLPDHPAAASELRAALAALSRPPLAGAESSPLETSVSGKTYRFEPNPLGVEEMRLDFDADGCVWTLRDARGEHRTAAGRGAHRFGVTTIEPEGPQVVAASGAWLADDSYCMSMIFYETPFHVMATWRFDGDSVRCVYLFNVSFGPRELPELRGMIQAEATG